jgi:hypothetical protein
VAVDLARVAQVFACGVGGGRVGSGYAVAERLVLTAGHVCGEAGLGVGDRVEVCVLGCSWVSGSVVWLDAGVDAALIRVDAAEPWPEAPVAVLRWGRLVGGEPVTAAAVGGCCCCSCH